MGPLHKPHTAQSQRKSGKSRKADLRVQALSFTSPRPLQHSEKIARVIRVGQQVELLIKAGAFQLIADIAQGREILGCEADAVEQGDLGGIAAARGRCR